MTLALERKTRADLAARSPVLAKLHATLIGIRNAHAYPARVAIDAYFDAAALRARARMGHLTWQLGDATAGTIAFDAATLMPASEETALAGVLVPIAMAIAEDTWTAINASGASQRPVRVKSSATRSFKLATNALNFEVKASPNTIDTGDPAWDAQRPSVQSIAAGAQSRAVNITDTTRAALAQTISTGADRGYSIQQIANGVPDDGYAGVHAIIDETYKNRSLAIAQYELGTAQNRASTAQYSASGLETVEVMDDEGENSCDVCIEIDGQIWPIDVADSDPLEHPWCSRAFVPHFPEDEPDDEQPETEEPPSGPDVEAVAASTPAPAEVPAPIDDGAVLPNSNLLESAEPSVASPMLSDADWAAMTDAERDAWSDMTPEERVDWLATFHAAPPPTVANADWQAMTEDEQTAFLHANPHAVIEPPPDAGDYGMTADSYGADIGKIPANVAALGDGSPPPHPGYWDDLSAAQQAEWTDAEDQATQDFMDTHAAPGDPGFSRPGSSPPLVLGDRVSAYDPGPAQLDAEAVASSDWEHGLSNVGKDAIESWTRGDGGSIRSAQMAGLNTAESRDLEAALAAAPKYAGTVYRGASGLSVDEFTELTSAQEITLRADSSTSKEPTTAFLAMEGSTKPNHVYYVIDQTSGADIEGLSGYPGEHEVVALRGGTYTVDSVEQIAAADNADFTNKPFTLVHLTETAPPDWRKGLGHVEQKAAHPNAPVNTRLARFVGDGLEEWQITKETRRNVEC